jgi:nitrite reductase/ring-hydroxylating ferredoxin subunit
MDRGARPAVAFRKALEKQRLLSARRMNLLSFLGVSAFLAHLLVFGVLLGVREWEKSLPVGASAPPSSASGTRSAAARRRLRGGAPRRRAGAATRISRPRSDDSRAPRHPDDPGVTRWRSRGSRGSRRSPMNSPDDRRRFTRREALVALGAGAALAQGGCKLLGASHRKILPTQRVTGGKLVLPLRDLAWLKPGLVAQVNLEGYPEILVTPRPEGGYYVVTGECTHFGCTVGWNLEARQWRCPCHGSWFRADGRVVRDPAKEDLQAPPAHVVGSDLVIDVGGLKRG